MASPIVKNFIFSPDERTFPVDESTAYVQIISFPGSHLWIWIGDQLGAQQNLSLAMGPLDATKKCQIISTQVLNSANPDEASLHGKSLSERISKKLGGKPVYLSCFLNSASTDNELLNNLEKQIIHLVKTDPDMC